MFAKKFANVSTNSNLSAEFLTRPATFEQEHSQPVAPSGESNETTTDDDTINTQFKPHGLREALRQCKKNSSGGNDRLTYELLNEVPRNHLQVLQQHLAARSTTTRLEESDRRTSSEPNKFAFETRSYIPIALTSVLCKLME